MVNVNNINRLINVIKNVDDGDYSSTDGFFMGAVFHTCGTPSCIKGFINAMLETDETNPSILSKCKIENECTDFAAGEYIGISKLSSLKLFYPFMYYSIVMLKYPFLDNIIYKVDVEEKYDANVPSNAETYYNINKDMAVKVLEHLRDTGVIDWTIV